MKLILFLLVCSLNTWSAEIKLVLDKPSVFTGEVVGASVGNYQGPEIRERKVGDVLYILHLNGEQADIVFLKKPSVNTLALNESDFLIWNPIEVKEVQVPEEAILDIQEFDIKSKLWIIYLFASLLTLVVASWVYLKKIRPAIMVKKEKIKIKNKLFAASELDEVTGIWKEKHVYLEAFPFIEDDFNKFEVVYYKHGFKPYLNDNEKKEIIKSYLNFLDSIRGGSFGV